MTSKTPGHDQKLHSEAEFIYQKIFKTTPDKDLIDWYIKANQQFNTPPSEYLRKIMSKNMDLEAIEYKLRLKDPHNTITRKVHIILYLAETEPRHYHTFINPKKKSFLGASFILFYSGIYSAYKLLKGLVLYRNDHV